MADLNQSRMRALAITNIYPSAARPSQGVFVEEQVKGLLRIGVEVRVIHIDRRQEGPLAYYRMGARIEAGIAELNPTVLHVMYGGVMAERVVRRFHRRPVVVTFHGSDLLGENLSGLARKLVSRYGVHCSRRAARGAGAVIVVARHLIPALKGCRRAEDIQIIACGIDLERFHPLDRGACTKGLGWDAGRFHVLFASSNGDPVKQPWLALAAVSEVARRGIPVELHHLNGIANSEVPRWLNAGDALLLTSRHEGSPTIVKEALACGLPVVSVPVGDVAERLDGIDGCHLANPDPADLAQKLSLVRVRAQRLNCKQQLADLSHIRIAHRLRECYRQVASI